VVAKREQPDFIARALGRAGVMPWAEAERAIRDGRVTLNGASVRQPMTVLRNGDRVRVDGREVRLEAKTMVLMLHKPKGCVCSTQDSQGRPTVFDALSAALPEPLRRYGWHAVGRLDVETTGMLLFTNDEHFVAHATAPETKLSKRYLARVQGSPSEADLETLRRGQKLEDRTTRPAKVRLRSEHEVELSLTEGAFHQVKRMLGAIGFPVRALHREAVGQATLDVAPGEARLLSDDEVRRGLSYEPRRFGAG